MPAEPRSSPDTGICLILVDDVSIARGAAGGGVHIAIAGAFPYQAFPCGSNTMAGNGPVLC